MKQVKINGLWETPPRNNIREWLNERIACTITPDLEVDRYIRRYEFITHIRDSGRHKPIKVLIINQL